MTLQELKENIWKIFPDADKISISRHDEKHLSVEISAEYEAPGRSLKQLLELAEVVGSTEIEEGYTFNSRGCDTCDYGSKYGVELIVPIPESLIM